MDDFMSVWGSFGQRRRIGNLQMQRRNLGVKDVAAIQSAGDCGKTTGLYTEVNGQTIAFAEIAIELRLGPRLPLVGMTLIASSL
jgi:hypothetical protein